VRSRLLPPALPHAAAASRGGAGAARGLASRLPRTFRSRFRPHWRGDLGAAPIPLAPIAAHRHFENSKAGSQSCWPSAGAARQAQLAMHILAVLALPLVLLFAAIAARGSRTSDATPAPRRLSEQAYRLLGQRTTRSHLLRLYLSPRLYAHLASRWWRRRSSIDLPGRAPLLLLLLGALAAHIALCRDTSQPIEPSAPSHAAARVAVCVAVPPPRPTAIAERSNTSESSLPHPPLLDAASGAANRTKRAISPPCSSVLSGLLPITGAEAAQSFLWTPSALVPSALVPGHPASARRQHLAVRPRSGSRAPPPAPGNSSSSSWRGAAPSHLAPTSPSARQHLQPAPTPSTTQRTRSASLQSTRPEGSNRSQPTMEPSTSAWAALAPSIEAAGGPGRPGRPGRPNPPAPRPQLPACPLRLRCPARRGRHPLQAASTRCSRRSCCWRWSSWPGWRTRRGASSTTGACCWAPSR
jgi:hypothetical protein